MSRIQFQQTPFKHDARSRRFKLSRTFGASTTPLVPLERDAGITLDQDGTLRCGGYGNAFEGFLIHGTPCNPDWHAAKIGQKQGRSVDDQGADPNACMKSMRDDGFLPLTASSQLWQSHGVHGTTWHSYNKSLDDVAKHYDTAVAFFKVDGPEDTFNNIWRALLDTYSPVTKRGQGVDAFSTWYHEWSDPEGGIILDDYHLFAGYHRYVFFGVKFINSKPHLVAKNSYGARGDNGVLYFPREVVNREFAKWGVTLKQLRVLTKEQLEEAKKVTPLGRLWDAVIQAWYQLSEKYGFYA